jgi:hypothetical protein
MIRGSCLCGTVRYEISGPFSYASNCHCGQCRKAHGAAFASYGVLPSASLTYLSGREAIQSFASSPTATRTFCRHCGSNLEWRGNGTPERTGIALGTLDDDPGIRPQRHIHVASGAPWFAITDDLPQFPRDGDRHSA